MLLGSAGCCKLFENLAELFFQFLKVLEGREFTIGVAGAAGTTVQAAQPKMRDGVCGVVLNSAFEKR